MADVVREPPPLPEAFYVRAANAWMEVTGDYMDELDDRLRAAVYAAVQLGDHAICWHTTCLGCAGRLDGEYADTVRAEQAEAEVERLKAEIRDLHETTIEYGHTCQSDAGTYICWCGAGPDSPSAQFQRTVTVTYGPIEPVGPGASEDHSSKFVEVDKGV